MYCPVWAVPFGVANLIVLCLIVPSIFCPIVGLYEEFCYRWSLISKVLFLSMVLGGLCNLNKNEDIM